MAVREWLSSSMKTGQEQLQEVYGLLLDLLVLSPCGPVKDQLSVHLIG